MTKAFTGFAGLAARGSRVVDHRGFTLIELLIVVVIIGLLATISIPMFDGVRQRAYNSAVVSDLHSAALAIEEYFSDNLSLPNEDELMAAGFGLSEGVSFTTFSIRDASDPKKARVHMHIDHEGSLNYYHMEYPDPDNEPPEQRWK